MSLPRLVATCWTSAGDVLPAGPGRHSDERSPLDLTERVRAVAVGGWAGLGLLHADLAPLTPADLDALAVQVHDAGLDHVEVELLDRWWLEGDDGAWRPRWRLLLEAATALHAAFVKMAPPPPGADLASLVRPLRALADEAAAAGTRLALEPLPWSGVTSIPAGADLVRAVGHPGLGLVVDAWHVFRAGTTLDELAQSLAQHGRSVVLGVELDDADDAVIGTLFEDTRDRRRYCGEGSFDLVGLVRVLGGAGFDGPWGVEALSDEHRALPLPEALSRARDSALAVLTTGLDPMPHPTSQHQEALP